MSTTSTCRATRGMRHHHLQSMRCAGSIRDRWETVGIEVSTWRESSTRGQRKEGRGQGQGGLTSHMSVLCVLGLTWVGGWVDMSVLCVCGCEG